MGHQNNEAISCNPADKILLAQVQDQILTGLTQQAVRLTITITSLKLVKVMQLDDQSDLMCLLICPVGCQCRFNLLETSNLAKTI